MSSSEANGSSSVALFVPDVETCGPGVFEPETARVRSRTDVGPVPGDERREESPGEAVDLEQYLAGAHDSDARRRREAELRAELEQELERRREQDGALLTSLQAAIAEATDARMQSLALRATDLAMTIALRLVRDRIEEDPAVVERALREAVDTIGASKGLTVHAHPDDAAYLRGRKDLLAELGVEDVVDDPRQKAGGCFVEDGTKGWDQTFVGQLARFQEAIEAAQESP